MKRCLVVVVALAGCSSDLRSKTHAFVADTPCGQGPYDIHIAAEGKMGEEGLEVIACTSHRLTGVAEMRIGNSLLHSYKFGEGEVAENGRCLASPLTTATAGTASASGATAAAASGAASHAAQPVLVERPYTGSETRFADDLCRAYGLTSQSIMGGTLTRTDPGVDMHVRIWSDVPNDLQGVVFLVQHLTSKKTKEQVDKEWAKLEREQAGKPQRETPPAKRMPEHGPPPAPLVEARPAQSTTNATWIAGYWQWTGAQWGWVAGFWRDERVAMPAPRVEVPGAMPGAAAVWVGGVWQLRGGAWIWVEGRWRR